MEKKDSPTLQSKGWRGFDMFTSDIAGNSLSTHSYGLAVLLPLLQ